MSTSPPGTRAYTLSLGDFPCTPVNLTVTAQSTVQSQPVSSLTMTHWGDCALFPTNWIHFCLQQIYWSTMVTTVPFGTMSPNSKKKINTHFCPQVLIGPLEQQLYFNEEASPEVSGPWQGDLQTLHGRSWKVAKSRPNLTWVMRV